MTYDPVDRLVSETTLLGTVNYQFDAIGRRTSMTVSGQSPLIYRNALGLLGDLTLMGDVGSKTT
jgi:YD repeat-containing protein